MAKRGETWSDDEVLALISIWSDEAILKMLATSHENADIYGKISSKLETLGFKRDLKQCRTKVKHLKTTYKKYKDALARSDDFEFFACGCTKAGTFVCLL